MTYCAYCTTCNKGKVLRFRSARQRDNWLRVHYLTRGHPEDKITVWAEPTQ